MRLIGTFTTAVAVAVLALLGACGNGDDEPATAGEPTFRGDCPDPAPEAANLTSFSTLALDATSVQPLQSGHDVSWQLTVSNRGDQEAVLVFNSGQVGDVVLAQDGEEAYRWSLERMFTQAVQCFNLPAGESATLVLDDDTLEIDAGEYDMTATVLSQPAPPSEVRTVTVGDR